MGFTRNTTSKKDMVRLVQKGPEGTRYFKITNLEEKHHGFQWIDGLNKLKGEFATEGSCVAGGLYFSSEEHITNFFNYGTWIREVFLLEDDPDFQMVHDGDGDYVRKWRANMVIVGPRYHLDHPTTYEILGIEKPNKQVAEHNKLRAMVKYWEEREKEEPVASAPEEATSADGKVVTGLPTGVVNGIVHLTVIPPQTTAAKKKSKLMVALLSLFGNCAK